MKHERCSLSNLINTHVPTTHGREHLNNIVYIYTYFVGYGIDKKTRTYPREGALKQHRLHLHNCHSNI